MLRIALTLSIIAARFIAADAEASDAAFGGAAAPESSSEVATPTTAVPEASSDNGVESNATLPLGSTGNEAGRTATACGASEDANVGAFQAHANPNCIARGYLFKPQWDRYGGDIFQTWDIEKPSDVRAFCEREIDCAGFNWPWGVLKWTLVPQPNGPGSSNIRTAGVSRIELNNTDECQGLYIRIAGAVSSNKLICPDTVEAAASGDVAYGMFNRTFDTLPENCTHNKELAVVLPSQIECTHPPGTKFTAPRTEVRCMWLASPSIGCKFDVTRNLRCSKRKLAAFSVSVAISVFMIVVSIYILVLKVPGRDDLIDVPKLGKRATAPAGGAHGTTDPETGGEAQPTPAAEVTEKAKWLGLRDREDWELAITAISVLAGSIVAALQATEDCKLTR